MLGPRGMDGSRRIPALDHRPSTKHLISRYESMSPALPVATRDKSLPVPTQPSTTYWQKKDKSPIRQSFRNLFSVFKKSGVLGKGNLDREVPLSNYRKAPKLVVESLPLAPPVTRSRSRQLSSSLLYLSRTHQPSSNSSVLPVWTVCTATLENDRIVISGLTAQNNPSIHTIFLSHCTDVRSLSVEQLDCDEAALLPRREDSEELKVFEILFEGRVREKFAAPSVRERAGWISAIWDAILPSQDPLSSAGNQANGTTLVQSDGTCSPASSTPKPLYVANPSLSPPNFGRSLPPVPNEGKLHSLTVNTYATSMHARTGSLSPVSPSIYPSTRPVSRASLGVETRSKSPSIMDLGQLSVVKQRLAQIEQTSSQSSHGSLASPALSRASRSARLRTPSLSREIGTKETSHAGLDMSRIESSGSSTANAILDSYSDPRSTALVATEQSCPEMGIQEPPSRSRFGTTPGSPLQTSAMGDLSPLVELLHDHAAKSYDQTANLGDQIVSIQSDIQRLPIELASVFERNNRSKTVADMVSKLEEKAALNSEALKSIHNKMDEHWINYESRASNATAGIMEELQTIRTHLVTTSERAKAASPVICVTELENIAPSRSSVPDPLPEVDLSLLHAKLDVLLTTCSAIQKPATLEAPMNEGTTELANVIALLEESKAQQAVQAQQQNDSIRYLNELNSWLETFTQGGISQIQGISAGVEQLCRVLGSAEGDSSVFRDVQHLVLNTTARDQSSATLQASMDALLAMMSEQSAATNVAQLTHLIDRQRQDQESMWHALSTEISGEIRGERLRFVEAMKEATAINVQIHVEQFKEELKREVVEMTQEVGRLHQDREAMQNQIADLFAFYTKQKASEDIGCSRTIAPTIAQASAREADERLLSRSAYGRPLPQPRRA